MSCTYLFTDNIKLIEHSQVSKKLPNIDLNAVLTEDLLLANLLDSILSNPEAFEVFLKAAIYKIDSNVDKLDALEEEGIEEDSKRIEKGEVLGANRLVEYLYTDTLGGKISTLLWTPAYDEPSRIEYYIKEEREKRGTTASDEDLRNEILSKIEDEKLNSKIGTIIHSVISKKFKDEYDEEAIKSEIKEELTKDDNSLFKLVTKGIDITPSVDDVVDIIIKQALDMVGYIQRSFPKAKKIYSEFKIFLNEDEVNFPLGSSFKKLEGIIDLMVVDENDEIHLIDFKVCNREFDDWFAAKLNHTDYQLGVYRAMLSAKGIDETKVHLYTAPIVFPKEKINSMRLEGLKDRLRVDHYGSNRLSVVGSRGKFTRNIDERIKRVHTWDASMDFSDVREDIEREYLSIIGQHELIKNISYEIMTDSEHLKLVYDPAKKANVWRFFNILTLKWETFNTKEAAKERIKNYIKDLEVDRANLASDIIRSIDEYKREGTPIEELEYLRALEKHNPTLALTLQDIFGKYTKEGWKFRRDLAGLELYGILVFESDDNPSRLEVVTLTSHGLNTNVPINGTNSILGKWCTEKDILNLPFKALPSEYRYLKVMEAMAALNVMAKKQPGLFHGQKLNNIIVLNTNNGELTKEMPLMETYKANFSELCKRAKIENVFDSEIVTSEVGETLLNELMHIIGNTTDEKLTKILLDFGRNPITLEDKKRKIENMLKALILERPRLLSGTTEAVNYNLEDPWQMAYVVLSQMNAFYNGIDVHFDGRYSGYNLSFGELLRLLGLPFTKGYALNLRNGDKATGFMNGLWTTSPQTSPAAVLRLISESYDRAFLAVRNIYDKRANRLTKLTKFISDKHSELYKLLISGENSKIWERFVKKDKDGKFDPDFKLIDPWSEEGKALLDSDEREFLKNMLWELNKYKLSLVKSLEDLKELSYSEARDRIDSLPSVIQAKMDGRYFEIPLRRASTMQKLKMLRKQGTFKEFVISELQTLKDNYDPRELTNTRAKLLQDLNEISMYNNYNLSAKQRVELLEKEGLISFSIDLDLIAHDMAFLDIRQSYYDKVLLLTDSVATTIKYICLHSPNTEMEKILDTLDKLKKVSITGQPIVDDEWHDVLKGVGFLQKINSFLVLALRPLTFFKELIFGLFINYSRAFAYKGTSFDVDIKNIYEANKVIWGQSGRKYLNAFSGRGDITDFTLVERINRLYGIANEDMNRLVDNTTLQRTGASSRLFYISNSAPDYYNRMTLFIAKMMLDGCYEAHDFDSNGNLRYDWKKDKRFSELAKYGLNSDHKSDLYILLKALYINLLSDEEKTYGKELKYWNEEKQMIEYKDISLAYTIKERNSIKEVSDMAYGFYDHESKSLLMHMFIGKMWLQFQTYLTAKFKLYFGNSPSQKGENTSLGKWVPMKKDGKYCYRRPVIKENQIEGIEIVTEDLLTEDEKGKLDMAMAWEGDHVEGIIYSIGGLLYDILHGNLKDCFKNQARLVNLKLALHDLLVGLLLMWMILLFFSGGTGKTINMNPLERVFYRATRDIGPTGFTELSLTPSFVSTYQGVKRDLSHLLSDDPDVWKTFNKRFGFARDFYWEEP